MRALRSLEGARLPDPLGPVQPDGRRRGPRPRGRARDRAADASDPRRFQEQIVEGFLGGRFEDDPGRVAPGAFRMSRGGVELEGLRGRLELPYGPRPAGAAAAPDRRPRSSSGPVWQRAWTTMARTPGRRISSALRTSGSGLWRRVPTSTSGGGASSSGDRASTSPTPSTTGWTRRPGRSPRGARRRSRYAYGSPAPRSPAGRGRCRGARRVRSSPTRTGWSPGTRALWSGWRPPWSGTRALRARTSARRAEHRAFIRPPAGRGLGTGRRSRRAAARGRRAGLGGPSGALPGAVRGR